MSTTTRRFDLTVELPDADPNDLASAADGFERADIIHAAYAADLAAALRKAADEVESSPMLTARVVRDLNGNTIGGWQIVVEEVER